MQFCANLSRKSMSTEAIYIHASGRSCYTLSQNVIVYYTMSYYFGDICIWNRRILLHFCWFSIFFHILITNTPWTVAWTAINQRVKWNSVMRSFRCIYVNCFKRLRFLAEVSTKLFKLHFFGQFTGYNSGRKHGN